MGSKGPFFVALPGFRGDFGEHARMQYVYELRENRGFDSILVEMMKAMNTHVFVGRDGKPFEGGLEILFIMGDGKIFSLLNCSEKDLLNFRSEMFKAKGIPTNSLIKIYSKSNTKIPILEIGTKRKIYSAMVRNGNGAN